MTPTATPTVDVPVFVAPGSERVIDIPAIDSSEVGGTAVGTGPLPSATLEYVRPTAPRYPLNELENGEEGSVVLRVLVDLDGKPLDVTIETSSGNRTLDRSALQHAEDLALQARHAERAGGAGLWSGADRVQYAVMRPA